MHPTRVTTDTIDNVTSDTRTHLECCIAQEAIIWPALHQMWHIFKVLPGYITTHATIGQKPKVTTCTLSLEPESPNFIPLPSLHQRLRESEISRRRVTSSFEEKGIEGASIVITFWPSYDYNTCPFNFWRMCDAWLILEHLTKYLHPVRISSGSGD